MAFTEFFAGIPVADFPPALSWNERLWSRPPDFVPQDGEAVWRVSEHAWIDVVADAGRAGSGLITVLVDGLDDLVAQLLDRGIDVGSVQQVGDSVPGVRILDAEGNQIAFGQPPVEDAS